MSAKELCAHDLSILNLIFDQNRSEAVDNDSKRPTSDDVDCRDQNEGNSPEISESKRLEVEGVNCTESGELEVALEKFNRSIEIASRRPSAYNNRAQLYRLLDKDQCESHNKRGVIYGKRD